LASKKALCEDVIAYRHPTFGNFTEQDLGHWYFSAHDTNYHRSDWETFEGLTWLLSSESDWLPEKYRQKFIAGLCNSDRWLKEYNFPNSFIDILSTKNRNEFKLTKNVFEGLNELVLEAIDNLKIDESSEDITQKLIDKGLVSGYYDFRDWISNKMEEHRKT
jgi:hypothetical protein